MELDAVDRQLAVADGHHVALGAARRDLELLRDRGCSERVVAAGLEALGQALEEPAAVVLDLTRLAVDEPLRLADLAAEGLDDHLVAEADAERRHARAEPPDELDRDARARRPAGAGGDDEVRGREPLGLVGVDGVVTADDDLRAELAEQVREVVGERVVVVDQQDHPRASASSIAISSAASLRRHSSCSAAGSESATIPAPACSSATPSCSTTVRIAMHASSASPGSA